MKRLILLLIGLLVTVLLKAQYTGGQGGGYASASWVAQPSSGVTVEWGVNPASTLSGIDFVVSGAKGNILVKAWDPAGRLLMEEKIVPLGGESRGKVGEAWASGIYLIQVEVYGNVFIRKQGLISQ